MIERNENKVAPWTIVAVVASVGALVGWMLIKKRGTSSNPISQGIEGLFSACDRALKHLDLDKESAA